MKRWMLATLVLGLAGLSGCSMCCGPYDYDYPTFGGLKQRVDRRHGRVGSIFSDPSITHGYSEIVPAKPADQPSGESQQDESTPSQTTAEGIKPLIQGR